MSFPDVVLLALCVVGLGFSLVAVFMMARSWLTKGYGDPDGFNRGVELAISAYVVLTLYSAVIGLSTYTMWLGVTACLLGFAYIRLTRA